MDTLPGLGHILKKHKEFPVYQVNMIAHHFYNDLPRCELAVCLAEITQGSLKFQYVLERAHNIVLKKGSKLVVLSKFPFIIAILFLVNSLFPTTASIY